jgi:transposase InsO family protein
VNRLQEWWAAQPMLVEALRRGPAAQRHQRCREHDLRQRLVEFSRWAAQRGWSQLATAALLEVPARTLRHWQLDLRLETGVHALGRPVLRSARAARQSVLEVFQELGAGVGLPTLRSCFPDMARAELADLLRRYRRVLRRRYHETLHVLHWTTPGSVWAMDFTEAPGLIDGQFPYLLAVRDLASGQQLLWQPTLAASAQETISALALLFALYGPPLVLKSDNGSAFLAEATQALLGGAGVIPLYSPPYLPQYNGAIEAGIGSLKTRSERQAARRGHPGAWTLDDVVAAQAEANALARPRGDDRPSPEEAWAARRHLRASTRALFQMTLERLRDEERTKEGLATEGALSAAELRRIDREAIRRALVEHGLLLFSRRRIPLPIRKRKAAKIT